MTKTDREMNAEKMEKEKEDMKAEAEIALMASKAFVLIAVIDEKIEVVSFVRALTELEAIGMSHFIQVILPAMSEGTDIADTIEDQ